MPGVRDLPALIKGAASPYANPFRGARITFERVDQGVDFGGSGPVYALGGGVIVNVYNSGWPGGVFIVEHLTSGPQAGSYWYVAENVAPNVTVGQVVTTATVIGTLGGGTEVGWAAPPPLIGESLAHKNGHFTFPTPEGEMAARLLKGLGVPSVPGQSSGPSGPGPGSGGAGGGGIAQAFLAGASVVAGMTVIVIGAAALLGLTVALGTVWMLKKAGESG